MKLEQFIEDGGFPKNAGFNFSLDRASEVLIAAAHRIIALEKRLSRQEREDE